MVALSSMKANNAVQNKHQSGNSKWGTLSMPCVWLTLAIYVVFIAQLNFVEIVEFFIYYFFPLPTHAMKLNWYIHSNSVGKLTPATHKRKQCITEYWHDSWICLVCGADCNSYIYTHCLILFLSNSITITITCLPSSHFQLLQWNWTDVIIPTFILRG